ncbi:uncharacterized protein LOC129730475 [Wyeomyia smithii]|uniref:uncharacterized protein LOC129730475 n=1 Tax=Wyeomyia smithii TaxID=174621 RepID=UPI002467F012|nr:uncharacterized protein LOC129730475 [Wyeomyia smithii]
MQVILFFVAFLSVYYQASALSCYQCNSVEDGTCPTQELIECNIYSTLAGMTALGTLKPTLPIIPSTTDFQCYKLIAEQLLTGITVTIKGCAYGTTVVCDGVPLNASQKECRTCTGDGCNSAARLTTGATLALALLAIIRSLTPH